MAFPRWSVKVRPRSFLIEVMVRYVDSKKSCSSPWEIFVAFLQLCAGKKIEPIMWDWGCYNHDHRVNWGSGPRILDPVNPTNNVAKPFRCWGFLRKYARKSLEKIQQKEGPASHWASSEDETVPRLSPANPEEVRKVLLKMGLPQRSVEGLLAPDFGFTSLEVLCQLGKESDFVEVGMNKAQARLLCKALETGGYIFRKLESEGRQVPIDSTSRKPEGREFQKAESTNSETQNAQPAIPLMCYPAQGHGRCFLTGTLVSVLGKQKVAVEDLRVGRDSVLSASNEPLNVISVNVHPLEKRWMVELMAQGASLTVTENHRMQVFGEAEEDWVEIEARKLKMGDLVPCTGGGFCEVRELQICPLYIFGNNPPGPWYLWI